MVDQTTGHAPMVESTLGGSATCGPVESPAYFITRSVGAGAPIRWGGRRGQGTVFPAMVV